MEELRDSIQNEEEKQPAESHAERYDGVQKHAKKDESGKSDRSGTRRAMKYVAAFAAGFAACIAVFAVIFYTADLGRVISKADYDYYKELTGKYGKYYVIMNMIKADPLAKEAADVTTDAELKKLVSGLGDPYAAYYTEKEYEEFSKSFQGEYVGVGIVVAQTDKGIVVEQVFQDGPAHGAGMKVGDIIYSVDGVKPEDLDDAVSRMTGKEGTKVTVTVSRDGEKIDFKMKRKAINLDSVGYAVSEDDPKVGYIRLAVFAEDSDEEVRNAVKELQGKGCDKFILDLRDNGGGLTDISINIADYLLPECRIMTEVTKDGKTKEYDSKPSSADLDMVVLVNENTASASEILTAAIKENDAGKVIGTKTFGKGVTQASRQFKDGTAVKLTISEYLTPDGNHVQGNGIEPDIEATDDDILDKAIEVLND